MKVGDAAARVVLRIAALAALAVAAGCASPRDPRPVERPAPPPLRLVSAGELELPRDCDVRDGVPYRTNFVVGGDGRVLEIRPEPAPACLSAAISAWLASARYAPPGEPVAMAMDWIGVSARRGD